MSGNRHDDDTPQPGSAAEEQAVQAAGVSDRQMPVSGDGLSPADGGAFRAVPTSSHGPVPHRCASGMRPLTLCAVGEVLDARPAADVPPTGEAPGFGLSRDAARPAQPEGARS